jgi:uncharacterized membrane protein HdeD (DUF308 family)
VTAASPVSAERNRYWLVPLVRAVAALIVAGIITFTANHSAVIGLYTFGAYALVAGVATLAGSFVVADRVARPLLLAQGIFGIIAGIVAIVLNGAGLGVFLYTVSVWAALTGFCELYCGLRVRGRLAVGRDWLVVGVLTAVLAIVFLLIPVDAVLAVGLFGAYCVVIGVYLAIGALTLRWGAGQPLAARTEASGTQASGTQAQPSATEGPA